MWKSCWCFQDHARSEMEPFTPGTTSKTITASKTVYNNDPALMSRIADLEDLGEEVQWTWQTRDGKSCSYNTKPYSNRSDSPYCNCDLHIKSPVHRNLLQTFDAVVEETGEALPSDVNHPSGGYGKSLYQSSIGALAIVTLKHVVGMFREGQCCNYWSEWKWRCPP